MLTAIYQLDIVILKRNGITSTLTSIEYKNTKIPE